MAKSRKRRAGEPSGGTSTIETIEKGGGSEGARLDPQRISMRAYEMYLARGGADGKDWDDWLAAERELTEAESMRSRGQDE